MVTTRPTWWTVQAPEGVSTDRLFFDQLVVWQRQHGRHGLPWQGTRDPYRVWLSEVMLQQTQVSTVLGYYPQFLARFPDVQALAEQLPAAAYLLNLCHDRWVITAVPATCTGAPRPWWPKVACFPSRPRPCRPCRA